MKTENKINITRLLDAGCALMAALGTLPVASADLPLPPSWRPYIIAVGFGGAFLAKLAAVAISAYNKPSDPQS